MIANFEFYACSVKDFLVLGSTQYPCKKPNCYWEVLGSFKAHNSRTTQTFMLKDPALVRYIKILFLSHYGDEHFCTLSLVRVHGSTLLDDLKQAAVDDAKDIDKPPKDILIEEGVEEITANNQISKSSSENLNEEQSNEELTSDLEQLMGNISDIANDEDLDITPLNYTFLDSDVIEKLLTNSTIYSDLERLFESGNEEKLNETSDANIIKSTTDEEKKSDNITIGIVDSPNNNDQPDNVNIDLSATHNPIDRYPNNTQHVNETDSSSNCTNDVKIEVTAKLDSIFIEKERDILFNVTQHVVVNNTDMCWEHERMLYNVAAQSELEINHTVREATMEETAPTMHQNIIETSNFVGPIEQSPAVALKERTQYTHSDSSVSSEETAQQESAKVPTKVPTKTKDESVLRSMLRKIKHQELQQEAFSSTIHHLHVRFTKSFSDIQRVLKKHADEHNKLARTILALRQNYRNSIIKKMREENEKELLKFKIFVTHQLEIMKHVFNETITNLKDENKQMLYEYRHQVLLYAFGFVMMIVLFQSIFTSSSAISEEKFEINSSIQCISSTSLSFSSTKPSQAGQRYPSTQSLKTQSSEHVDEEYSASYHSEEKAAPPNITIAKESNNFMVWLKSNLSPFKHLLNYFLRIISDVRSPISEPAVTIDNVEGNKQQTQIKDEATDKQEFSLRKVKSMPLLDEDIKVVDSNLGNSMQADQNHHKQDKNKKKQSFSIVGASKKGKKKKQK